MQFSSSRMLPGQSYARNASRASAEIRSDGFFKLARELLEEEVAERVDVFAARAQRRHGDGKDVDAEEEVLAEAALFHLVGERRGSSRR